MIPLSARLRIIACTAMLCVAPPFLVAQESIRTQLFAETDRILGDARAKHADVYTPTSFTRGMEYYRDAEDLLKKGKNIDDIREALNRASALFSKALDGCKLAEVTFSSAMAARTDAVSADAPRFSTEKWEKGEKLFRSAASDLEDGDVNDARKTAGEAETYYRGAELEAIQSNYLGPTRTLLARAEDADVRDNAPATLAKARSLASRAEELLKANRYDTDEARQVAQQAKTEAAHAIYLDSTIRGLRKQDKGFEQVFLSAEEPMARVAAALDIPVTFEAGFNGPAQAMISAVTGQNAKTSRLEETVKSQEREIANLRQQISSMESRLGTLSDAEKALQNRLEQQRKQEQTIADVATMFDASEGNVLRDGNNIIIRLYGLTFPVGRSTIEPRFFPLLTKVQDAIRKFPGCQIAIEGHTDSQGSDVTNQSLSENRAEAIAQYLKANMGSGVPITSQGYGESRPIATNETFEGRAKNRRIDVVIVPEWAIVGK